MRALKQIVPFLAMAALIAWQPLIAQEKRDEPNLARSWVVTPKPDSLKAFNAALKEHIAWRIENKDPWQWTIYRAATGEMDSQVYIRSAGHTFAELDAYAESEFAAKASEHFSLTVLPYVADLSAHLSRFDKEMSHWTDQERDYRVFWVTRFHVRPGHGGPFRKASMAIKAKMQEAGRIKDHAWYWALNGDQLGTALLVSPRENWAGHAPDEKSIWDTLVESVGEEKAQAMVDEFYSHVDRVSADVYLKTKEFSAE